jgi:DNA-binding transcriptional ArsR family regulator
MAGARRTRPKAVPEPTPELLAMVARRFRVLADPARLLILHQLQDGERTVGDIVEATGLPQGTVSKHLQQLHASRFVSRRRDGLFVHYALADDDVLRLCQMVCGRLDDESARVRALFAVR